MNGRSKPQAWMISHQAVDRRRDHALLPAGDHRALAPVSSESSRLREAGSEPRLPDQLAAAHMSSLQPRQATEPFLTL